MALLKNLQNKDRKTKQGLLWALSIISFVFVIMGWLWHVRASSPLKTATTNEGGLIEQTSIETLQASLEEVKTSFMYSMEGFTGAVKELAEEIKEQN